MKVSTIPSLKVLKKILPPGLFISTILLSTHAAAQETISIPKLRPAVGGVPLIVPDPCAGTSGIRACDWAIQEVSSTVDRSFTFWKVVLLVHQNGMQSVIEHTVSEANDQILKRSSGNTSQALPPLPVDLNSDPERHDRCAWAGGHIDAKLRNLFSSNYKTKLLTLTRNQSLLSALTQTFTNGDNKYLLGLIHWYLKNCMTEDPQYGVRAPKYKALLTSPISSNQTFENWVRLLLSKMRR